MVLGTTTLAVFGAALFLAAPSATAGGGDTFAPAASIAPSPMPASLASSLPSGVAEVMKMYKGGIPADIMISYVNNSPLVFYLSADNIISLQQQGVPMPVINAMLNRYGQSQRQNSMMAGAAQAQQPQYGAPQAPVPAQAPPPQYYSYDSSQAAASYPAAAPAYPAYDPYYYDPYYYNSFYPGYWGWPGGISFGYYGGFGRGFGGGFGHGGFGGGHAGGGGFGGGHAGGGGFGGGHAGGGGFGGGGHGGGGGHR
jgi:hypothetical protein